MTSYTGNDIYCDEIIPGNLKIEIIEETDIVLAFHHTKPYWPVHIVVTPKKHIPSILELHDYPEVAKEILRVLSRVSDKINRQEGACRILTNLGTYQDSKHLHFHVSAGKPLR